MTVVIYYHRSDLLSVAFLVWLGPLGPSVWGIPENSFGGPHFGVLGGFSGGNENGQSFSKTALQKRNVNFSARILG